jgi:Ca-activated chloride channel family protein
VPTRLDLAALRFDAPDFLPLLAIPVALLLVWGWQAWRRRDDILRMRRHRELPTAAARERMPILGDLGFWLCMLVALALTLLAVARPVSVVSMVRTSGIDLVILQDGSASMRVRDVQGNRWQRSMRFLRTLGESLQWDDDRIALALFATIAAPQVRLTRDPNTFFFFLDHLETEPPFRLEDDTTWDTNIERGIYWGLRLIEKDAELRKAARELAAQPAKPKAFVLVTDGQAWSGQVAQSLALAQERGVPIFVVGVGTTVGGIIPEPGREPGRPILSAQLDRASLATIATAGGGRYFEVNRETDREIANAIIEATRRRAESGDIQQTTEDLYWSALLLAAIFLALGVFFLRDRASLLLQLAAAAGVLMVLTRVA